MTDYEQKMFCARMDLIADKLDQVIDLQKKIIELQKPAPVCKATSDSDRYKEYKANGGKLKWNDWHLKDKRGIPIEE